MSVRSYLDLEIASVIPHEEQLHDLVFPKLPGRTGRIGGRWIAVKRSINRQLKCVGRTLLEREADPFIT